MHLQAEPRSRLDQDALDLEARALVDRFIPAPGAVHPHMGTGLGTAGPGQRADHVLDGRALRAMRHQHRVGRFHHRHVVEADHADQAAGRVNERVARIGQHRVALAGIACRVVLGDLPDRVPGAQVAPAGVEHDHLHRHTGTGVAGRLHHRVVDAFGRNRGERRGIEADEGAVVGRLRPGRPRRGQDVRPKALECVQPDAGAQHEHAAVPEIAAVGDIAFGGGEVGLFDEGGDRHRRRAHRGRRLDPDVAEARFRTLGADAEDDDAAAGRRDDRPAQRVGAGGAVGDRVIGGRHHQNRVGAVPGCLQRCQRECRRRVAAHRLE